MNEHGPRSKPPTETFPRISRKCEKHGKQIAFFEGYGKLKMACGCYLYLNQETGSWKLAINDSQHLCLQFQN